MTGDETTLHVAGLHFAHGLQQLSRKIASGLIGRQFSFAQRLALSRARRISFNF
jgi:hypothetical protein